MIPLVNLVALAVVITAAAGVTARAMGAGDRAAGRALDALAEWRRRRR